MKHLSHRTIAIIVALLSTLSLALAVISLPHQAYAVDGTDGTSGTNSTSQGSDGDSAPIAGPVPNIIVTNFTYGGDSVAAGADFNLDFTFQNMGQVAVTNMVITVDGIETFALHRGLDVGDIAFALVHIFHRDRVFLAGDHLVGHYGITDFEPVRLTDRHGNLDIGLA